MSVGDFKEILLELKTIKEAAELLECNVKLLEGCDAKRAKSMYMAVYVKTHVAVLKARSAFGVARCAARQLHIEKEDLKNNKERQRTLDLTFINYLTSALRIRTELLESKKCPLKTILKWYLKQDYTGWFKEI